MVKRYKVGECERAWPHDTDMVRASDYDELAGKLAGQSGPFCPETIAPCDRMCQTICNRRAAAETAVEQERS